MMNGLLVVTSGLLVTNFAISGLLVDISGHAARPGHAMLAADPARAHGAVIGKAMSALSEGEVGMVLALVQSQ